MGASAAINGAAAAGKASATWASIVAWESGYFSRYGKNDGTMIGTGLAAPVPGAANDEMICESCHNVLHNVGTVGTLVTGMTPAADTGWKYNLLLARYRDAGAGIGTATGAITDQSKFCVGCHVGRNKSWATLSELNDKPAGTHPITGSTVSRAVAESKTPTIVITATGARNTYANAAAAPTQASYPTALSGTAGTMDCDSCHRPHDAAAASATATYNFILETATTANPTGAVCLECHAY